MRSLAALLFLTTTLAACAAPTPPAETPPTNASGQNQGTQTLIKFKDSTLRVDVGLLTRLGQASAARIDYVRAMADGTHVLRIRPLDTSSYERVLASLRADPVVDYVEPDAVMRIQR